MSIENLSPKGEILAMRIGYARVSTRDQNLEMQLDALNKAGCKRIFTDKLSGAQVERPGLNEALSHLREADTLVVWKLDCFFAMNLFRWVQQDLEVKHGKDAQRALMLLAPP